MSKTKDMQEFKDRKAADYDPKYEDRVMEYVKKNELERGRVGVGPRFFFQAHFSSHSTSPDLHILDHSRQSSHP
ncbi:hypothetical protein OROMI_031389 [Orobanche minor]